MSKMKQKVTFLKNKIILTFEVEVEQEIVLIATKTKPDTEQSAILPPKPSEIKTP